eukprot:TRINITY_DN14929_c0_g1_i2.p1 TRINITY_DN14929_c0_g1~~TRINITY_DN14929_c0_g1_i2.p1  ORF type:complete len:338 (-),score=89.45 TRINITY_DN14929_c0_g1_i2:64-1077(-)
MEGGSLHIVTPLIESPILSEKWNVKVLLKMDFLQPSGSFKMRGIGRRCQKALKEGGCTTFVCSSGGNAGLAVAHCGRKLGVKVTVVVPESTGPGTIEKLRKLGAHVIIHGPYWDVADQLARKLVDEDGGNSAYIHPFDHPDLWEGHSTMAIEIGNQLEEMRIQRKPKAIVASVGGGGLLTGLLLGLDKIEWTDVPIVAVETLGAASFHASMSAGDLTTLKEIKTVAVTLGARTVCHQAFKLSHGIKTSKGEPRVIPQIVSDSDAIKACLDFADDHRVLIEPACGASLAVLYESSKAQDGVLENILRQSEPQDVVVVIVCGGSGVSLKLLEEWRSKLE